MIPDGAVNVIRRDVGRFPSGISNVKVILTFASVPQPVGGSESTATSFIAIRSTAGGLGHTTHSPAPGPISSLVIFMVVILGVHSVRGFLAGWDIVIAPADRYPERNNLYFDW